MRCSLELHSGDVTSLYLMYLRVLERGNEVR